MFVVQQDLKETMLNALKLEQDIFSYERSTLTPQSVSAAWIICYNCSTAQRDWIQLTDNGGGSWVDRISISSSAVAWKQVDTWQYSTPALPQMIPIHFPSALCFKCSSRLYSYPLSPVCPFPLIRSHTRTHTHTNTHTLIRMEGRKNQRMGGVRREGEIREEEREKHYALFMSLRLIAGEETEVLLKTEIPLYCH